LGKNRDRLKIVADILQAAAPRSNKTNIMFAAKLSFKLLEKYLNLALNAGFVQVQDSAYSITERGVEFLSRYSDFQDRYAKAQETLETLSSEYEKLSQLCVQRGPNGAGSLALVNEA